MPDCNKLRITLNKSLWPDKHEAVYAEHLHL